MLQAFYAATNQGRVLIPVVTSTPNDTLVVHRVYNFKDGVATAKYPDNKQRQYIVSHRLSGMTVFRYALSKKEAIAVMKAFDAVKDKVDWFSMNPINKNTRDILEDIFKECRAKYVRVNQAVEW
jgi:hypothetical protein